MGDTGLEPVTPSVSKAIKSKQKSPKTPGFQAVYHFSGASQAFAYFRGYSRKNGRCVRLKRKIPSSSHSIAAPPPPPRSVQSLPPWRRVVLCVDAVAGVKGVTFSAGHSSPPSLGSSLLDKPVLESPTMQRANRRLAHLGSLRSHGPSGCGQFRAPP
jgi:hypothetical protein